MNKTIDVIIPVYNSEKFILDAIRSVENQTLKPNNIFIIDDGSTDKTRGLILDYKNNCSIPIIYIYKENGGPNTARNKGLLLSIADFVAFLDGDDVWKENKLEKQINLFENPKFSNLGLVYCLYDLIDENGNQTTGTIVPLDKNYKGKAFNQVLKANKILSSSSGVLIKREVFSDVGLFDEKLRAAEDWDMWLRISEKYEIDFVDEVLVKIRRHSNNTSNDALRSFVNELAFYNKWVDIRLDKPIPTEWKKRIIKMMIKRLPKIDFFRLLKDKLSINVYKKIFGKRLQKLNIIYCMLKILLNKLIKYGKR